MAKAKASKKTDNSCSRIGFAWKTTNNKQNDTANSLHNGSNCDAEFGELYPAFIRHLGIIYAKQMQLYYTKNIF